MGKRWKQCQTFIFLGSKIIADGDCSHEIKRRLLLGRRVMTNLDRVLKSRDITVPTKVRLVKAMVFPVVMYGCESWTVKKAEHRRIDAFELWCWRRLLRVPWTARTSNQSILQEISPGCSLEEMMLKLKLQYLGHLMWRLTHWKRPWCWEGLGSGGEGDNRGWDGWMASPTRWAWVWVNLGSWWWTGRPGVLQFMGSQRAGHDWLTELNWTSVCYQTLVVLPRKHLLFLLPSLSLTRIYWVTSLWKDLFCLCFLILAWGLLDPIARSSTFPREARTYHFIIFFSLPFDQFHLFHPLYNPCLWQPPFYSL